MTILDKFECLIMKNQLKTAGFFCGKKHRNDKKQRHKYCIAKYMKTVKLVEKRQKKLGFFIKKFNP